MDEKDEVKNKEVISETCIRKSRKNLKGKMVQRSEASLNISEFHLTEVGKERVRLKELITTSQKLAGQDRVKKQLLKAKTLKSLSVPLNKPQLQKIKRSVAYDKVCNEMTKWDPVVQSNRVADQIIYPLKKPELRLETFESVAESFVTKHPIETAVNELLKKSESVMDKTTHLTAAEKKALKAMSAEEAKLRHNELMRHRALISYKEAKARRQNKIKSKRYHRILKKEKLKQVMKEFEALKDVDKQAALEKLVEVDKLRILERMTLKHRNTGKWAKQQKLRAKYNPESRSVLKEDLAIGHHLREKVHVDEDTVQKLKEVSPIREVADINEPDLSIFNDGLIESSEREIANNTDAIYPFVECEGEMAVEENGGREDESSEIFTKKTPKRKSQVKKNPETKDKKKKGPKTTVSDTMQFADCRVLNSLVPDSITFGDEDLDDAPPGAININEAFADEELIAEFREEKRAAERANRPQGIDLFLPGWGSWGGPSIRQSRKKRRKFFLKPVEEVPKKNTLGNVIINEDKDKKAAAHQVSELPFPFSNVRQFESYVRQPVGTTWNPPSSFERLVAPKVVTKAGKVIEPMDAEDAVLETKAAQRQPAPPRARRKARKRAEAMMPF